MLQEPSNRHILLGNATYRKLLSCKNLLQTNLEHNLIKFYETENSFQTLHFLAVVRSPVASMADLLITVPLFHLVLLYMSIDFGNGKVSVSERGCWNLRYNFISILDVNEDVSWMNPLPEFSRKRLQIVSSILSK